TATYSFTPPGGAWDGTDSGTYTITMQSTQVSDIDGNFVPSGVLASFLVNIPQTFLVTNTNDSGAGSLRNAIFAANASAADDIITFDTNGIFANPTTISLNSPLPIGSAGGLTIVGTGPSRLTIRPVTGQI